MAKNREILCHITNGKLRKNSNITAFIKLV